MTSRTSVTRPRSMDFTSKKFPREQNTRKIWIEALGIHNWEPKERSAICSEHFQENAFYETKLGLKKIISGAVPTRAVESTKELKASVSLKVCRICLAIDVKMHHITDVKLEQLYMEVTGLALEPEDRLPKMLCWECVARLRAAKRLRDKAAACYNLLITKLNKGKHMTIGDVRRIKRGRHNLQSTLVMRCFDNDDCDLEVKQEQEPPDEEEIVREELDKELGKEESDKEELDKESDREVLDKEESDKEELDWEELDKEELDWGELDKEELNCEALEPEQEEPEVKDGNTFVEEYPGGVFESDDDSPLSKVYKKRARNRKGNVKPDKEVIVAEKEDSPTSTMDRYKVSSVRRRKTDDALDWSRFTVCTLTFDEQITEIQQRAESSGYRLAPYKCTVCYSGFATRDRYDAHVVRHSEQYGAYECFICKSRLKTTRALRKHLTALHTKKFSCKDCPFKTKSRSVAREHDRWHAGTKYQCPHCPSEFDKMTTYLGHLRIKHVSKYVCELCGYTFISQKGIDRHKERKHRLVDKTLSLDGPYCAECDVRFVSEEAHARHLKLSSQHSSDDDPNRLRNEAYSMNTECNGGTGRRNVHPRARYLGADTAGPISCEQCDIKLRNMQLYAQHFRRAHPDKNRTKYSSMKTPSMCEQCGRIFQCKALLKDHMRVHTGEMRFKCDLCDKSFAHKSNLSSHRQLHSSSRPSYECPVCGKHYSLFKNRRRHMLIHTGLKPFKCDTCSKCFTTAGEKRSHVDHIHLKKPWPKKSASRARRLITTYRQSREET